jgi:hypothetical protein
MIEPKGEGIFHGGVAPVLGEANNQYYHRCGRKPTQKSEKLNNLHRLPSTREVRLTGRCGSVLVMRWSALFLPKLEQERDNLELLQHVRILNGKSTISLRKGLTLGSNHHLVRHARSACSARCGCLRAVPHCAVRGRDRCAPIVHMDFEPRQTSTEKSPHIGEKAYLEAICS